MGLADNAGRGGIRGEVAGAGADVETGADIADEAAVAGAGGADEPVGGCADGAGVDAVAEASGADVKGDDKATPVSNM